MQSLVQRFYPRSLPERRQIIAWSVSLVCFLGIFLFARKTVSEDPSFLKYALGLYVLDSFIFLALFDERPKMKLVMLTFIFLLEVAVAGYYLFTLVSTG